MPWSWNENWLGAGFSKLAIARSAPEIRSRTAPGVAGPARVRRVPAERRAVLAQPGDLGGAAVEREVGVVGADAPARRRGRAGCRRPRTASRRRRGRRSGRRPPGPASVAISGQAARLLTRSVPNSALPPHATARTDGPTSSARRNPIRLGWLARFAARRSADGTVTSFLPRAARSRPSASRMPSASRSTRTRAPNGEPPVARPVTSARFVALRGDRNGTTGANASWASAAGGGDDGEGESPGARAMRAGPSRRAWTALR